MNHLNESTTEFLRLAAPGVGLFHISLNVLKPSGDFDKKSFDQVLETQVSQLVTAADEVRLLGTNVNERSFLGDGKKLLIELKPKSGSVEIPAEKREWFCSLRNFWANRPLKREPGVKRGDIAVEISLQSIDLQGLFSACVDPCVISNYTTGLARSSVALTKKYRQSTQNDKVLLLFPVTSAAEGFFLFGSKRAISVLIEAAIQCSMSTIPRTYQPVPKEILKRELQLARQDAAEIVARLRK